MKKSAAAVGSVTLAPAPATADVGVRAGAGVAVGIGAGATKLNHTAVTVAQKRATRASIGSMPVKPASG